MTDKVCELIRNRSEILNRENNLFLGSTLQLTTEEKLLNSHILKLKNEELSQGHKNTPRFLASKHFFNSKSEIDKSKLFRILRNLYKGGSLHTHMLSAVSVDYIINDITYRDNLYGKYENDIFKLRFFHPSSNWSEEEWTLISEMRLKNKNFDSWLRSQLSLVVDNPKEKYSSIEQIWNKFKHTFTTLFDMICYKPVFEDFLYRLLLELHEDNVNYVELRSAFMQLYDLNKSDYSILDYFTCISNVLLKFKSEHKDFIGLKYIHSVFRGVSTEELKSNIEEIGLLKEKFPEIIVGLDLVGFEDDGNNLLFYYKELCHLHNLNLYLHAGETNWYGFTDLNLVDAILLNSRRLGHAYALPKHPVLQEMVKEKDIAIELSPISNQVLMLVEDLRNHPLVYLLANGFPVVICNDDPSAWDASGLSYDWYVTLMAMTPSNVGLQFLKQSAINSIKYSALNEKSKEDALKLFDVKWIESVNRILNNFNI